MLQRLGDGTKQIRCTKRGLSLFEDPDLAESLIKPSNAPLLNKGTKEYETLSTIMKNTQKAEIYQNIEERVKSGGELGGGPQKMMKADEDDEEERKISNPEALKLHR